MIAHLFKFIVDPMKKYFITLTLVLIFTLPLSCVKKVSEKGQVPPLSREERTESLEPTIIVEEAEKKEEPVKPQVLEKKFKKAMPQIFDEKIKIEKAEEPEQKVSPPLEDEKIKDLKPDEKSSMVLPTFYNEKDGSDMAYIHGGYFVMGDNKGEKNERPETKIYVRAFYIDIYEVTNKQYKLFNNEFENSSSIDCDLCPASGVIWEEAESYCKWAGKRLPGEAEWEKAARGTQKLIWPWGNLPKKDKANITKNAKYYNGKENYIGPYPVGSFPQGASIFGVFDMAGNAWEWTASPYTPYDGKPGPDIRYNKKEYRVLRGGSWKNLLENSRTTLRHPVPADTELSQIGFRCAKDVKSGE